MTGVPRFIAKHRLNIRKGCQPIRQKRRGQVPDRNKVIQEEVAKLVEARILREVHYHDWLSNPIMDTTKYKWQKKTKKKQLSILTKEFSATQRFRSASRMSFGLKYAEATYQRLIDKAFENQISQNLEVYVDDLVVKIHTESEIHKDIEETFHHLRKINMKLNPKKCTFGAEEGAFLGHVVSTKEAQSLNGKLASVGSFTE
ncbi:reverse transcriptase domain-containing protein [Tanacetum coccineum]